MTGKTKEDDLNINPAEIDEEEVAMTNIEVGEEDVEQVGEEDIVEEVGKVLRKKKQKEATRLVPPKVKEEEDLNKYTCGYKGCRKSFTSAVTMVSHLEKHYS